MGVLLLFGSLMSKVILLFFAGIGAAITYERLKSDYPDPIRTLTGAVIIFWLILGAIYEYKKIREKKGRSD
jgi:hypothetical protein